MENQKKGKGIIVILIVIIVVLLALLFLIATQTINLTSITTPSNQQSSENNNIKNNENNDIEENNINNDNVSTNSNVVNQKSSVNKSQILSYYKEKISLNSDKLYSVTDINNDSIPELFIYTTGTIGNEIIAYTSIFTYDENKGDKSYNYIVEIGSIDGRIDNNTTLYKMNDGRLLSVYGHMGYEKAEYFNLENDWLVRTEISYKQTENYTSGDTEIQFKNCSDTSLIDNFN